MCGGGSGNKKRKKSEKKVEKEGKADYIKHSDTKYLRRKNTEGIENGRKNRKKIRCQDTCAE